jgi:hypothetical protein
MSWCITEIIDEIEGPEYHKQPEPWVDYIPPFNLGGQPVVSHPRTVRAEWVRPEPMPAPSGRIFQLDFTYNPIGEHERVVRRARQCGKTNTVMASVVRELDNARRSRDNRDN